MTRQTPAPSTKPDTAAPTTCPVDKVLSGFSERSFEVSMTAYHISYVSIAI